MTLRSAYREALMCRPDAMGDYCAVCGGYCSDGHHAVQKGMGGVPPEVDALIPRIGLCRRCHDEAHAKRLHLQWDGGWKWLWHPDPMGDELAWRMYSGHYSPVKEQRWETFGRKA